MNAKQNIYTKKTTFRLITINLLKIKAKVKFQKVATEKDIYFRGSAGRQEWKQWKPEYKGIKSLQV